MLLTVIVPLISSPSEYSDFSVCTKTSGSLALSAAVAGTLNCQQYTNATRTHNKILHFFNIFFPPTFLHEFYYLHRIIKELNIKNILAIQNKCQNHVLFRFNRFSLISLTTAFSVSSCIWIRRRFPILRSHARKISVIPHLSSVNGCINSFSGHSIYASIKSKISEISQSHGYEFHPYFNVVSNYFG